MNQASDFDQEVVRTTVYLSDGLKHGMAPDEKQEGWLIAADAEYKFSLLGMAYLQQEPAALFSWAAKDYDGFLAAKLGIAQLLGQGKSLPSEATDWLIKYLRDEVSIPKAKRGPKNAEWKNLLILTAVQTLVLKGYSATRNDVTDPSENPSACDIVATALSDLGLEPSKFDAVKQLWKNRKNLMQRYVEPG